MMATTEIEKVPQTIRSRSQVFELKTIAVRAIADQLRRIADAEQIRIDDAALMLVARAGDGSMRDAQSALDQVIAFAGSTVTAEDVSAVLGLVRRDLLLDIADAVAREDGAAAFEFAGQAVEAGYDLRLVIRELARLTRDLLVVSIDRSRLTDPEIAADAERDRLLELAGKFSHEDLMRAFEVLSKAEFDIRASSQPRYHLEMALLRWIHLRKLVPLSDLILGAGPSGAPAVRPSPVPAAPRAAAPAPRAAPQGAPSPAAAAGAAPKAAAAGAAKAATVKAVEARREAGAETAGSLPNVQPVPADALKDAFLNEVRTQKKFFYGTVIAQAQRIEIDGDRVLVVFAPQHRALRAQLEQSKPLLETIATQLSGRRMTVAAVEGVARPEKGTAGNGTESAEPDRKAALREQALADSGVQAMLDVFAAEIKEIEEM
jgi:DNA polymerase-3 subunit gamma/tau